MNKLASPVIIATVVLALSGGAARAQLPASAVDSAIARAQQRAAAGDSASARAMLDSLQTSAIVKTAIDQAEVMYWLARLAPTPEEREKGLTMLIVEYPFVPRAAAAQFELGMLELARADRDRAATHLAGFLAGSPKDSNRTTASLTLGRLLFDKGETARACAVLLSGKAEIPPTSVELLNRFEFATGPCRGVDTSVVVTPPVDTTTTTPSAPLGEYTVQVAAYDRKDQADRLATRLRGQGFEARVIGPKKPFRVRVGHFLTHSQADAVARRIDALTKMKPFVTLVGPVEK